MSRALIVLLASILLTGCATPQKIVNKFNFTYRDGRLYAAYEMTSYETP